MVNIVEVWGKRPTRAQPNKIEIISRKVVGQEEGDSNELLIPLADYILDCMERKGFLPQNGAGGSPSR